MFLMSNRIDQDKYYTPYEVIEPLTKYICFNDIYSFYEPCYGSGNIVDVFTNEFNKNNVSAHWSEIDLEKDYLKQNNIKVDLIVTNPPFSLALEFLKKSLKEANTVIYLLRINFLGSQKRKEFFEANRPTHLFTLSKRPSFVSTCKICGTQYHPNSKNTCCNKFLTRTTDSTEYAWIAWDYGNYLNTNSERFIWV
jgi:type I restriction-modification system DNA methylase subunit